MRLERDAASYRGDRYPERQRAERARARAGDTWCRANEARLRSAMWSLACFNDAWPLLARVASAEVLTSWHRTRRARPRRPAQDGAALDSYGAELPAGTATASARDEVLGLLEELVAARQGTDAVEEWTH
ncbi:hypothetical protein [Streptomyces virginiae]|uniref:hypothetical protein n=1 Tax=Streptomyces virginiae TaxID=1961 RepID=UPI002F9150E0|nr:hypothetical protein OG253_42285 [Streptomyces virginiae]